MGRESKEPRIPTAAHLLNLLPPNPQRPTTEARRETHFLSLSQTASCVQAVGCPTWELRQPGQAAQATETPAWARLS